MKEVLKKFFTAILIIASFTVLLSIFGEGFAIFCMIAVAGFFASLGVRDEYESYKYRKEQIMCVLTQDLDSLYTLLCDDFKCSAPNDIIKLHIKNYLITLKTFKAYNKNKEFCQGYEDRLNNLLKLYNYQMEE